MVTKMIRGLEDFTDDERVRELCLLSLEKRKFKGDLVRAFNT